MRSQGRSNKRGKGLDGKNILLIVTGGIAAYKAAYLVRLLKGGGAEVRVILSEAAARFVTPLTFETLSGNPVPSGLFARRDKPAVQHVEYSGWAERIIVAPATADFIAKAALGLADDLPSTVLCAAGCPVFLAPAMNDRMWANPAVRRNLDTLQRDGRVIIEPASGELACGSEGSGRMREPEEIVSALEDSFGAGPLRGVRFLVTAGRTEEEIDPVRYISNRSTGRMGCALAARAAALGAEVNLIHGPVDFPLTGIGSRREVKTAAQMKSAVSRAFGKCDVLVMAAAVADYRPVRRAGEKLKRTGERLSLEFIPTVDILESLKGKKRPDQIVVGFALESAKGEKNALEKGKRKGCDYLALNMISDRTGFNSPTNQVTLFRGGIKLWETPLITKEEVAAVILDELLKDKRLKKAVK
ncbi:MAG: bifunctional phosphopantothenoylcysteine decarboxylase/phosphopantothenate--cysteine ligase CoaBC [Candidatus Krumholzibacteriota bacterium]|nr:bifunctional phosphopantothenoylcysteine decarboxylase/phosphopantothenate--cysteine ligase CoaBC [Candidatus Krumholzibacteriota bacterium]